LNVVQEKMAVPGFKYDTFMCSECHDIERRLVFTKHGQETATEPMPLHTAPAISPASTVQDEPVATLGLFRRVLAKLRNRYATFSTLVTTLDALIVLVMLWVAS
jgi:hypothetical protein